MINSIKRSRVRVGIWIGCLVIASTVAYILITRDKCDPLIPAFDSQALVRTEEQELLQGMRAEHQRRLHGHQDITVPPAPDPLSVRVSGTTAFVEVASSLGSGANYVYPYIWHRIYFQHHRGDHCVRMHVTWPSGHADYEVPPPLTL